MYCLYGMYFALSEVYTSIFRFGANAQRGEISPRLDVSVLVPKTIRYISSRSSWLVFICCAVNVATGRIESEIVPVPVSSPTGPTFSPLRINLDCTQSLGSEDSQRDGNPSRTINQSVRTCCHMRRRTFRLFTVDVRFTSPYYILFLALVVMLSVDVSTAATTSANPLPPPPPPIQPNPTQPKICDRRCLVVYADRSGIPDAAARGVLSPRVRDVQRRHETLRRAL